MSHHPGASAEHLGRILDRRWRLDGVIGQGGQGVVFAATEVEVDSTDPTIVRDRGTPGAVVVKVTDQSGTSEIEYLTSLHHRHLVPYLAAGALDAADPLGAAIPNRRPGDLRWLVMPRATGALSDAIGERSTPVGVEAQRPMDAASAEELWLQLSDLLTYLESQKVVHGDIKPANILSFPTRAGSEWRVTDLGIMVDLKTGHTNAPAKGYSPAYGSPWVLEHGIARPRDDRYSAALVVHLAATGALPSIRNGLVTMHPNLPPSLRTPLAAALGGEVATFDQHSSSALTRPASSGPSADRPGERPTVLVSGPGPDPTDTMPPPRRSGRLAMVGVAIALLLVAAGLWWTKGSHDDDANGADATTSTPSADATTTTPTGSDGSAADGSESTSPATEPELGSERELVFLRGASGTKSIIAQDEPIALADADPIKASLSDDGTMALIVRTDDGARLALGRVDEPDVQVLEVSQGNVQDVDIAPDGSQIAFTDEAGGDTDIAVLDLSTLEVRTLLASSGDDRDPAWSSDSTRVAAVRSRSTGSEIVIIDAASGAATPVTDGAREVSSPTWSPDDQQIAYLRRDGGSVDIVVQEVTDPDPKLLALTPDQELDVTWCPGGLVASYARRGLVEFSPDGSSEDLTDSPGDANPNC